MHPLIQIRNNAPKRGKGQPREGRLYSGLRNDRFRGWMQHWHQMKATRTVRADSFNVLIEGKLIRADRHLHGVGKNFREQSPPSGTF